MRWIAIVIAAWSTAAAAQPPPTNARLVFEFDRTVVSPGDPSVTLTVSAAWDQPMPGDNAFGGVDYDLISTTGAFTGASLLLGSAPVNTPGTPGGSRIRGAAVGQITICGISGCLFSLDNPIALAEYVWETDDFTPRTVDFASEATSRFVVAPMFGGAPGPSINLAPGQFTPGAGSVTVVPAPAGALALGLCLLTGRRRR